MIPNASLSQLQAAIQKFDGDFRNTADWLDWEADRNHRYAILHNGRRYPVKQIIRLATGATDFSGGDEANSFVKARGFEVVTLRTSDDLSGTEMRDAFEWILAQYGREKKTPFTGQTTAPTRERFELIRRALQNSDAVRGNPHLQVNAGIGQGNWATVPWIALLDRRLTTSTQRGVYVVLLFRADLSGVYLTLNQGVTEPKDRFGSVVRAREYLRQMAGAIRIHSGQLVTAGFHLDDAIDLRVDSGVGQEYESSTVAYKLYERTKVPTDDAILRDIDAVLGVYTDYAERALGETPTRAPEPEPSPQEPSTANLRGVVADVAGALKACNVSFGPAHDELVRRFVVSLATKRFVILTGLSGSGKTQLALRFGEWLGPNQTHVAPVRPDWTGGEALFGFEDALQPPREGRRAWSVPEPLRFMLNAAKHTDRPFVLVLDEMNLAHVERYFADVLSGMESGVACLPNLEEGADGMWRIAATGPARIPVPNNLFVVGTVNVDETTYMFSPKVLDRANTFEFRVATADLALTARRPTKCAPAAREFVTAFVKVATDPDWHVDQEFAGSSVFIQHFRSLHAILATFGFEYGHRTFVEAIRFTSLLAEAGEPDPMRALDYQVIQKILPRIHGAHRRVMPLLLALGQFCVDPTLPLTPTEASTTPFDPEAVLASIPRLPLSFDKIRRMTALLRANKFVSFTE